MARNCFKELKAVKDVEGFAKMYYNFTDLNRYDSMLLLNYLIDTEPIVREICMEDGYEDYLRYSDDYIGCKLIGVTKHLINCMLKDLEDHNYIWVHHASNKQKGFRFIKLNYVKIGKALGISEEHFQKNEKKQ